MGCSVGSSYENKHDKGMERRRAEHGARQERPEPREKLANGTLE